MKPPIRLKPGGDDHRAKPVVTIHNLGPNDVEKARKEWNDIAALNDCRMRTEYNRMTMDLEIWFYAVRTYPRQDDLLELEVDRVFPYKWFFKNELELADIRAIVRGIALRKGWKIDTLRYKDFLNIWRNK